MEVKEPVHYIGTTALLSYCAAYLLYVVRKTGRCKVSWREGAAGLKCWTSCVKFTVVLAPAELRMSETQIEEN